ncbi:unnamed protein product [Ascophyllum nodosum]
MAQDGYLEMSNRIGGRSRIEGAVPARRVEGQETTPEHVSVDQNFAGEKPEPVEEDFARGESEPSAEGFAEGGHEHQAPRRDRAQQAANSFLLERSRECVPPWAVTNDSAPSFPRASRPRRTKASLDWRGVLECLDRRRYVSLAEYDHRHMELHRAIKELEDSVLSCRSREAAVTARVSLLRELASAGNSADLDVAPSYSRGWDETSRTEPDAPLEPAPPDFSCRASKETNTFEPTFGLRGGMDEFRRLKAVYPTASSREPAEFQVFAKAVAAHREDGRGSEDCGGDTREDTGDDRRRGRHSSRKDFKDSRELRPGDRPPAGPRW